MAAITNINVCPSTGPLEALVVFSAGSQDQGGMITASPAAGNIAAGDPRKLNDGQTYRLQYTSAVKKKLELEFNKPDYYFVNADGADDDTEARSRRGEKGPRRE